jgi:hypothetical protein
MGRDYTHRLHTLFYAQCSSSNQAPGGGKRLSLIQVILLAHIRS